MGLFSFFRTPGHRSFTYHPLTYNPKKEELLERIEAIQSAGKDSDDIEKVKSRIKGKMKRGGSVEATKLISYRRKHTSQSNLRVFSMIILLLAILYLVYYFN